jgi:predicted O-methyltransferase YrrM
MPDEQEQPWAAVDEYITRLLAKPDAALDEALAATAQAGMPPIAVSAPQGKLLAVLVQITAARHILELGTLGGTALSGWPGPSRRTVGSSASR